MNTVRHPFFLARQVGITLTLALFLTACSSSADTKDTSGPGVVEKTAQSTMNDAVKTIFSPLDDLGLKQDPIPETLAMLVEDPYLQPKPMRCGTLQNEVAELNELLGPDIDTPKIIQTDTERVADTGSGLLHDAALGVLRSHMSFIPFRGILRKITGADRHAKEMSAAYEAGRLRRAYIKGLASAHYGRKCSFAGVQWVKKDQPKPKTLDDSQHLEVAAKN